MQPTSLEAILLDVAIIAVLVTSIVLGVRALRNRR